MSTALALGTLLALYSVMQPAAMHMWPKLNGKFAAFSFYVALIGAVLVLGYWTYSHREELMRFGYPTILMIIGTTLTAGGLVWHLFEIPNVSATQPMTIQAPVEAPVEAPKRQLSVAEKEEAKWQAFRALRKPLQEAVLDAEGELISYEFPAGGIGSIALDNGKYTIPISYNDGLQVWINNRNDSIEWISRIGPAEHHEIIDITAFQHEQSDISVLIGETVIVKAKDGAIIQLLVTDAHRKANGDKIDDAQFRYRIYPPGTTQVRALRNGKA
jgi:hypothetical protein